MGHGTVRTWTQEWYGDELWSKSASKHGIDWSITMVNRQIRSETLPILYGKNTFRLGLEWGPRRYHYKPEETATARAKERCSLARTPLTVDAGALFHLHDLSANELRLGLNTMKLFTGVPKLILDGNDGCCDVCHCNTQKVLKVLSSLVKKLPKLEEVVVQGMDESEKLVDQVHENFERAKTLRTLEAPIHTV